MTEYGYQNSLQGSDGFLFSRTGVGSSGTYNSSLNTLRKEVGGTYGTSLYVTPSGNDTLASRGSITNPFQTLQAARDNALVGDTIFVGPGNYTANDLMRSGINWYFYPGSVVSHNETFTGAIAYSIFDDRPSSGVNCIIDGKGTFRYTTNVLAGGSSGSSDTAYGILLTTFKDSVVSFSAKDLLLQSYNFAYANGVTCLSGAYINVNVENIFDLGTGTTVIDPGDGITELHSIVGGVFWMHPRELYLKADKIITTQYCVWGGEERDINSRKIDVWIDVNYIEGIETACSYTDAYSLDHRTWEHYKEAKTIAGGRFNYLGNGKHYVKADKISCLGSISAFAQNGSGQLWLDVQKLTCSGSTSQSILELSDGKSFINIHQLEDLGGCQSLVRCIGGEHYVNIGYGNILSGKGIRHEGGRLELQGMKIVTTGGSNNNNVPVYATASGLVLKGCSLVGYTGVNARSVSGTASIGVANYGSVANTSGWSSTPILVQSLVVDSNVR